MDFMAVDLAGATGGLLCIWNPEVFQLVDCCSNKNFIILSGTIYNSFECVILNIYGPNDMGGRKVVWDSLARLNLRDWAPTPFRFLNAWTLHPKFRSFVENTWLEANVVGWAGFKCLQKLKILKLALKQWAKEVFGDVEHKLNQVEEEIHALDIRAEERPLSMVKQARRREPKGVAWKLSKMVEWAWIQKSRIKWSTQGDRNTKFFHIMDSSRRVRNSLCSIAVNGTVKEDRVEVRAAVQQHFINQFTEPWRNRPRLSGPFVSIEDREAVELLEAEFSENKIVAAVNSCEGNKAPGPDRFNLMMFKKC
ncbi:uncharacterized protein LOC114318640 [Camellia sinensis]|uniref:uncharacterized protein LOC114318640 n=1 Tax=Camellia sinensis TaxID=4442 RepID=UPI0010369A8A|nr:uncharacterized protein LOC114318640 [Camellia sinensis]